MIGRFRLTEVPVERGDWRRKPQYNCEIYIAMARDGDGPMYVKVGMSGCPEARLASVQTGCPIRILKALSFKCRTTELARAAEAAFHAYLADYASSGEWFRFDWNDQAKSMLEVAIDDLIKEVDGRELRQLDVGSFGRVAAQRLKAADASRLRKKVEAAEKHRIAVELHAPRRIA